MGGPRPVDGLREVLGGHPTGVSVVTVDAGGQRLGLTIGTLVRLSLEPPLVGFAVSRQSALHELLREAGSCAVSILGAGQQELAEHFARGVPPIAMWQGIEVVGGAHAAPLLAGALGWLECRIREEIPAGTHTLFACEVLRAVPGAGGEALVRVRGGYRTV